MVVAILIGEAILAYAMVLGLHALRHRVGLSPYYALLGAMTAIMSWVTDAGIKVDVGAVTFLVGSTVFYTSILLGVFVLYVFDGPRAARVAIGTVMGVSILVPLIAVVLNLQMELAGTSPLGYVPSPTLRINTASVVATLMDLIFLAVAWEFQNKRLNRLHWGIRAFFTLLGVMWLDVLLFNTGAFFGTPDYLNIMSGTFYSRLIVALFASPILLFYMSRQNRYQDREMPSRPLLAILQEMHQKDRELTMAKQEIALCRQTEQDLRQSERTLRRLAATDSLTGIANLRHFRQVATRELARARRHGRQLSMLMLDIDTFKSVNDRFGHSQGDEVLRAITSNGQRFFRRSDVFGRLGGEEFGVLLPETPVGRAWEVAERFRRIVEQTRFKANGSTFSVTVSIGVAAWEPGMDLDRLIARADQAMYRAKELGRNQVYSEGPAG